MVTARSADILRIDGGTDGDRSDPRDEMAPRSVLGNGLDGGHDRAWRRVLAVRASAQAFVWVVGFTIVGALLMNGFGDHHRLAKPGDLNINTRETMRERQAGPYFLSSAGCRLRRGMYGRGHYGICARYTSAERVRPPKAVRSSALASCH